MILEPKKIKSVTVSIVSPSICQEVIKGINSKSLIFKNKNLRKIVISRCNLKIIEIIFIKTMN